MRYARRTHSIGPTIASPWHDLVGRKNYPLAALLLSNAVSALDSYLSSTQVDGHRAVVYSMKGKIGRLLKEIMQTAA
jgi:hypothetical protein